MGDETTSTKKVRVTAPPVCLALPFPEKKKKKENPGYGATFIITGILLYREFP